MHACMYVYNCSGIYNVWRCVAFCLHTVQWLYPLLSHVLCLHGGREGEGLRGLNVKSVRTICISFVQFRCD